MHSLPTSRLFATLLLVSAPALAHAQYSFVGIDEAVTSDPAAQLDPSIEGDIVVFTDQRSGNDDVYLIDLSTGIEQPVATSSKAERLHDISGGLVVYTDYGTGYPDVYGYEIATGARIPIATGSGAQKAPSIDGDTVVFEDGRVSRVPDIWVTSVSAGGPRPLAQTFGVYEERPSVSGDKVVFERRASWGAPADVVLHDLATGLETVLAGTAADERNPRVDGDRAVWEAVTASGDTDLFIYEISTGVTTQLTLPGNQQLPTISGDILAFDDDGEGNPDVVVYHLPTGTVHRLPGVGSAEFLNDINGNRIAYTSNLAGNLDIRVFTFELQEETPVLPPPPAGGGDPCAEDSERAPFFSASFTRETKKPAEHELGFEAKEGPGVVAVRNFGCASAEAELNDEEIVERSTLNAEVTCVAVEVSYQAKNELEVELASGPGCEIAFDFYQGTLQACGDEGEACDEAAASEAAESAGEPTEPQTSIDEVEQADCSAFEDPQCTPSCQAGPGPAGWAAFFLVLFALSMSRREQAPVRLRRRN